MDRAIRRLEALKLKMVAAADQAGTAKDAGFTDTNAWVAKTTTVSRSDAARQVALANELTSDHDATAEALDAGLVSPGHAAVIVQATGQLPDTVSAEQRQVVEATLVDKASRFSPDQLRRIARRAIEAVEPDQSVVDAHENDLIRSEEQAAQDKCSFTLHDNGDGTSTGHFTVPALAAAILAKILDTMTAPRRMREPDSKEQPDRSFDWRHRRGLAFAELLEHLPTDHLHPKTAATVVVTIDHTVLAGALKAAHLDTGQPLSAGEARRLACNAAILPAVLGGKSVALDLGHTARLFSESQRVAKGLEHTTCAATGCERPYAWCELHHRQALGPRRQDRPRQRDTALPSTPPMDPRHRLQPPVHARRQCQIQQTHVRATSVMPRVLRMATDSPIEIPRPDSGDVVELILEDHRLFEHLLRELRNEQNDRDALRQQVAELLVAHGEAEESKVYPQLARKDAIDEEEAEHGEKEHQEGYEKLLPLLEATELYDEEFSNPSTSSARPCCTTSTRRSATSSTRHARTSPTRTGAASGPPGRRSATGCSTTVAPARSRCARSSTPPENVAS